MPRTKTKAQPKPVPTVPELWEVLEQHSLAQWKERMAKEEPVVCLVDMFHYDAGFPLLLESIAQDIESQCEDKPSTRNSVKTMRWIAGLMAKMLDMAQAQEKLDDEEYERRKVKQS